MVVRALHGLLLGALLLGSCTRDPTPPPLDAVALLTRASIDLRGHRPSLSDLKAVRDDPDALDPLLQSYVAAPGFGEQVAALFAPVFGTLATDFDIAEANFAIDDEASLIVALGEEPLRVVAEVAEEDLPYPTLFTSDWTVLNEHLAAWYPADYPEGETGWHRSPFNDHRPSAGILSTSGLWWRYQTTDANVNRGRANHVSRIFLCRDFLSAPIETEDGLDLLDEAATQDAIRNHSGCVACHAGLDPLGGFFWGFHHTESFSPVDLTFYNHARQESWREYSDVEPGYFGEPARDLEDLGALIAEDPRTIECAVQRTYTLMLQRELTLDDEAALVYHRESFIGGELTLRALFESILDDPTYRAAGERGVRKLVTPVQLASQVEELTGFRFTADGQDVLRYDRFGLRSLLTGGDATNETGSAGLTPMTALVRERIAQAAAAHVVAYDLDHPEAPKLFTVDFSETPIVAEDAMRAQLVDLHLRVLGKAVAADSPEVDLCMDLWSEAFATHPVTPDAWALVLELLLRHPDFLVY